MNKVRWIIYDGELYRDSQPVVSAESRGLMYGDGCFETFRTYSGRFLYLGRHMERLQAGLNWLGITFPPALQPDRIPSLMEQLLHRNEYSGGDALIRIQVWRSGGRGYVVGDHDDSHFSMVASELPERAETVRLATVRTRRIPAASILPQFKLSNSINYIAAAREARSKGGDDALMQTIEGHISETTIANVFWVRGNRVYTPSIDCDILPGITRQMMVEVLTDQMDREVIEGSFGLDELLRAEGIWICNSVRGHLPVSRVDNISFDVHHPIFEPLADAFSSYRKNNLI